MRDESKAQEGDRALLAKNRMNSQALNKQQRDLEAKELRVGV